MGLFSRKKASSGDIESIVLGVIEHLPMPPDTRLLSDASHHDAIPEGGYKIRRNFELDVSDRIPSDIVPLAQAAECSDDEAFYLNLRDALRLEVAESVLNVLGGQRHPHSTFDLACDRGETTTAYSCERGIVIVRSDLAQQSQPPARWRIDLLVFVYPHPGQTPVDRLYPTEYNNLRADGHSPDEARRMLRERYDR